MTHRLATESDAGATVLTEMVDQHASDASFLWSLRDAAVGARTSDLAALSRLDDRLDANLDGLRIAGDAGFRTARAALDEGGGGEAFVAAVLAVERADVITLAEILARGVRSRAIGRELVSALGWVPLPRVERIPPGFCSPATLRPSFGSSGSRAPRRTDTIPAPCWAPRRKRPTSASGPARSAQWEKLARADLLPEVRRDLDSADEACRFSAAWSAALLGEPAASATLWSVGRGGGPIAERAATMAARTEDASLACARVRDLASVPGQRRAALACSAALGDAALVPWMIEQMAVPADARLAGWALATITGCDLAGEQLCAPPPESFAAVPNDDPTDDRVLVDPDERLPWPDVATVQTWWKLRTPDFRSGIRYLAGRPLDAVSLKQILRSGSQSARAAAAIELRLLGPRRPLFEVRAPAPRQRSALLAKDGVPCGPW